MKRLHLPLRVAVAAYTTLVLACGASVGVSAAATNGSSHVGMSATGDCNSARGCVPPPCGGHHCLI